ncbi:hypothetical protein BaRGS_00002610 [Batillaria attramentaria]|uniref:Uncharacterized protein n=1 Tax=Batillaria attramentaria TaxID=370345 RepID=A0ABD0M3E3_9CAEN
MRTTSEHSEKDTSDNQQQRRKNKNMNKPRQIQDTVREPQFPASRHATTSRAKATTRAPNDMGEPPTPDGPPPPHQSTSSVGHAGSAP